MQNTDRLCMGCMNDSGSEDVCPICGHNVNDKNDAAFLPLKTWIKNRYLIGKAVSSDGEGVTYIGWDNQENTIITIREFFPIPIAQRGTDGSILVKEGADFDFNTALMDFLQLHKSLSEINLSAVSPVTEIIECNSSAYVISPAPSGITLREFLLRNGGSLTWEQAKVLFLPLISSIISLHENSIIHGGISPETILVGRDGKLRLTGFATKHLRQSGGYINAQLFPGYAAIEQYSSGDNRQLSEATDVYGFASTLFRVLMGSTLPEASERITDDKMSIPAEIAKALPNAVLVSLANALQILFEARTKTMQEFKLDIAPAADSTTNFVAASPVKTAQPTATQNKEVKSSSKKEQNRQNRKYVIVSALITAAIFTVLILIGVFVFGLFDNKAADKSQNETSSQVSQDESNNDLSVSTEPDPNLIVVPDFTKKNMTIEELRLEYPEFSFAVFGKKYSSKTPGTVVGQEIKAGESVDPGTTIYLTISLGQESIMIPNIIGLTKEQATIELFKAGFLYHNISFYTIADDSVNYGCVAKADPAVGEYVSCDAAITIYTSNIQNQTETDPEQSNN